MMLNGKFSPCLLTIYLVLYKATRDVDYCANWTIGLPTDNGHDSDQVFEFNGTQAVKIPDGVVTVNLKEPFMISVWMRHGPGTKEKETILCNSDKTGLSLH